MNKAYRLLKDLPGVNAGAVFTLIGKDFVYKLKVGEGTGEYQFNQDEINKNPDWFEEVNPEYYSTTKFKKGDILYGKGGSKVVYLGKGMAGCKPLFKGVVIEYPPGDYKIGEVRDDFFRGCFSTSAQ